MKPNPFSGYSSSRFVDMTPLPADIRAQRESVRACLLALGMIVLGYIFVVLAEIYGPSVARLMDSSPFGLVVRLFL